MVEIETLLYRNVRTILKRYGDRLLDAGFSILRSQEEQSSVLLAFLTKYKVSDGEVGTDYELDGYYLDEGGRVTQGSYSEMVRWLENFIGERVRVLIPARTEKPLTQARSKKRKVPKRLPEWTKTLNELADLAYEEYKNKKHRNMKKAAEARAQSYFYNCKPIKVMSLYQMIKERNRRTTT